MKKIKTFIRNSRIFARDYFRCTFINSERLIKEFDERVLIGHPPINMITIEIGPDVRNVRQCHFYLGGQDLFAGTRKISNLSFRKIEQVCAKRV